MGFDKNVGHTKKDQTDLIYLSLVILINSQSNQTLCDNLIDITEVMHL